MFYQTILLAILLTFPSQYSCLKLNRWFSEDGKEIQCLDLEAESALLKAVLSAKDQYISEFVDFLIERGTESIGFKDSHNFKASRVMVKNHSFHLVSSEIHEYELLLNFYNCASGKFELGNERYAVYGNFEFSESKWIITEIGTIEME
ncbi:hypothetical protein [Robiginitalea sp.]|uniref:hypothetical protein n=1 Tax=Robiginitalea sp. TaxID=1902411 RepID=UPI003C64D870